MVEWGDGWVPIVWDDNELAAGVSKIRELAEKAGRDFAEIDISPFGFEGQWRDRTMMDRLDKAGAGNYLLQAIGFPPGMISILFTDWATLLGMVYNLVPFTIFTLYLSLDLIDRSLVLAAYDAGASRWRAFWEITLPLCRPGIWAGSVLVFLLSVGVFLEPKVLGGGTSPMSADLIRQTFETRVNWPLGAALTLVLMLVSIFLILLFSRLYGMRRAAMV